MKQIREACLIGVFLLVSSCGLWAASVTLEPFESATGMRIAGQNNGAGSFTLSSENAKAGNYALKFDYNLPPGDYGYSNVGIFSNWHLPAADGKLGFWAYGNANRNQIILRIEDFSGEVFQYYLGYSSDCDEEWKWFEKDLASYDMKWGGNGNGVIDAPAKVQCIMVGGGPYVSGTIYLDELTFTAANVGIIYGAVIDEMTQLPITDAKIASSEVPVSATATDSEGKFRLFAPPGSHNLAINRSGYEQEIVPVTVAVDQALQLPTCLLSLAPDGGVFSDKANSDEQGLKLLSLSHGESWKGEVVEIGGRKAVVMNRSLHTYYLFYDVDDEYIFGGSNGVFVNIQYFDNGAGLIGLQYDTPSSSAKLGGTISRGNSNTWKEATIFLPDAVFANKNGGVDGDFRLGIWVPGPGFQDDAYIGKVSIAKQGRMASIEIAPDAISPVLGTQVITVDYRLTSHGIVSAWVEDQKGNYIVSLGDAREGIAGYFTWAGMNQQGSPVADGTYYIKLSPSGLAWGGTSVFTYPVEIITVKPPKPALEQESPLRINEPQATVAGRAAAGEQVRVYLNGSSQAEKIADAQGRVAFLLEGLSEGENTVKLTQVDRAGNESEPAELVVLYEPSSVPVGQITLSKPEIAPPDNLTIRFFVTGTRTLDVRLTFNGEQVRSLEHLTEVSGPQTVSWDGVAGGEAQLPDGSYQIEIYEGAAKLSQAALRINTADPQRPLLLLPEHNGQLSRGKVRFVWEGSKDARSYRLKIWQAETQYAVETYVTSYELETPLLAGAWQWQVEAVTASGKSAVSESGSFVVNPELPGVLEVTNVQGRPNPFAPNGNGRFEQFQLSYSLTQDAMVSIAIYNLAGNEVFRREALPEGPGDHAFAWDGRDRRGRIVPPGAYVLLILAKNEQNRAPGGARKLISVLY